VALIKVTWSETSEYEAEIEVDGYDPDEDPNDEESGIMQQILEMSSEQIDKAFIGCSEREVSEREVLRAGDEPIAVAVAAPKHEEMWTE
jgi:hypothetical protein